MIWTLGNDKIRSFQGLRGNLSLLVIGGIHTPLHQIARTSAGTRGMLARVDPYGWIRTSRPELCSERRSNRRGLRSA
jgi:hypothetical protein